MIYLAYYFLITIYVEHRKFLKNPGNIFFHSQECCAEILIKTNIL